MTPRTIPRLALMGLRELSVELHGGVVLDRAGRPLAGAPELSEAARGVLAGLGFGQPLLVTVSPGGSLVAALQDLEHAVVVGSGPTALPELLARDLALMLDDLRQAPSSEGPGASAEVASAAARGGGQPAAAGVFAARLATLGRPFGDLLDSP